MKKLFGAALKTHTLKELGNGNMNDGLANLYNEGVKAGRRQQAPISYRQGVIDTLRKISEGHYKSTKE